MTLRPWEILLPLYSYLCMFLLIPLFPIRYIGSLQSASTVIIIAHLRQYHRVIYLFAKVMKTLILPINGNHFYKTVYDRYFMKLYSVFLPYSLIIKTNVGLKFNHKNILIYKNTQNIIYSIILKLNRCPQKDHSLKLRSICPNANHLERFFSLFFLACSTT